jgi:ABC-type multidrug transport system ATPase subunit
MVNQAISQLGLESHRWKSSGQLSGGNKRKLCVAIALVGNPPIILLDEPSAGMDPEARRFMWSVVARIAEQRTSAIVLTTHSMDEAEALSTKMGIMVKGGVFKCFGSAQHIKNKFGTGYVIEIKIRDHSDAEFPALVDKYLDSVTDDSISLKLQDTTDFSKSVIDLIEARLQTVAGVAEKRRELYFQVNLYSTISAICEYF